MIWATSHGRRASALGAAEWRNSAEARAARLAPRIAPQVAPVIAPDEEDAETRADRRHVASVTRALAGKGFPFYPAKELRI